MEPDIHTQIFTTMSDGPKQTQTLRKTITARVLLLLLKMLLRNIEHSRRPKCFFFPLDVSLDGPPPPISSTPTCQFGSVRWRPLDAFTRNNTRVMGCARSASPLAQMIDPRTPTFDRFSAETPLRATAPPVVF